MSRGYGAVQRGIIGIFQSMPNAKLTIEDISAILFPDMPVTDARRESIRRALQSLTPELNLRRCRNRLPSQFGWRHVYGRA